MATSTTTGTVKLEDNLSSNLIDAALTSNQGRVLNNRMISTPTTQRMGDNYLKFGSTPEQDFSDGFQLRVTFPEPFINSCIQVQVTPYGSNPKAFISVITSDKTGFTAVFYETSGIIQSVGIQYMAIGN